MIKNKKVLDSFRFLVIPSFLLFISFIILIYLLYQKESDFFRNIYNNEVIQRKALIVGRFQDAMEIADSTGAFFASSQEVTKDQFDLFGSILIKKNTSENYSIPLMVEWADAQNKIKYVFPSNEENNKLLGLDLNGYPNRIQPTLEAQNTKSSIVTEPIMLLEGYPGILIYSPVFKDGRYLGETIVVARLKDLLAPVQDSYKSYVDNAYFTTENFIVPFDEDVIFTNNGERVINAQGDLTKDPLSQEYLVKNTNALSEKMIFANRTVHLVIVPSYTTEVNIRMAIYTTISCLFLIIIVVFLWLLQKRQNLLSKEIAKSEALVLSIGDGLVACDKDGVLTYINQKAEELFGHKAKESIGKSYFDVWRLVDKKGVDIPVRERPFYVAITKKEVTNVTIGSHLFILKNDGSRFPLASTITPIIVNNKVEGAIAVFRDISKESDVDRMKTEFLSLATHQLLTPCTAVKWTTDLFLKGKFGVLKKKQTEGIQDISTSNQSMINLVNSLLNVSRIESGRIAIDPKPTNLGDLVSEMEKELKNKIKDKNQSFGVKVEKGLPKINIDPHLIMEVYKNLLTNAIKYTPEKGKISVTISKVGAEIISKISDNGYGIPEKEKSRVFEKFYRGENITKIVKDGNGLGLYLVKQIVDVSGGKIGFESVVDKGSAFWFSLPLSGSKQKVGEVTIS